MDDNELQDAYKYYFPEQFEGDFEYVSFRILYFQSGAECHLKSFKSQDVYNYSSRQFSYMYIPFVSSVHDNLGLFSNNIP